MGNQAIILSAESVCPIEVVRGSSVGPQLTRRLYAALADFLALTKPEVNFLIVIATFTGFHLGSSSGPQLFPLHRLVHSLLATMIVASGATALNQYIEHPFDARMRPTARRPLVAGRLPGGSALWFGVLLSVAGVTYLFLATNVLASLLAVFTLTSYLFLYTPLKRKTPLCTLVGAVPGSMPPLIGWAAASGSVSGKAWILCAMLFLWQFPHFMSIAWMYREDYARAGYRVLPNKAGGGKFMAWLTSGPSLALLLLGLAAAAIESNGSLRSFATFVLGSALLYYAVGLAWLRSRTAARQLLTASIVYLPLQFLAFVLGRH